MSEAALGRAIMEVYDRLARNQLRDSDVVPANAVRYSTPRRYIRSFASSRVVYEDDARILAPFRKSMGAILDIGAHWGYMALSFRHAGSDCPIVSFEPMEAHHGCLDELRRLDGNYDFAPIGLGENEARVTLYGPVVNGRPIMGLNSIGGRIFNEHHMRHLVSLLGAEIPEAASYDFRLCATPLTTKRLDDVLASKRFFVLPPFLVDTGRIAVLKLDVEGHEPSVLRGAEGTIARDRPFVMVESGNRNPAVADLLTRHGYTYAEREGDRLVPVHIHTEAANGFWLHASKTAEYRAMGLL
jgi:FkbM family methyltransferase